MQIKLSQVVNGSESINSLLKIKLPVKAAYRLNRLANKLQPELKVYEEQRNKIIEDFGEKQEDGTIIVKDPEKIKESTKKILELIDTDIDIDFEPIDIDELGDVQIAAKDLVEWIFK